MRLLRRPVRRWRRSSQPLASRTEFDIRHGTGHWLVPLGFADAVRGNYSQQKLWVYDTCMGNLAIYAGSFDPPTMGHLWMIERGAALFDRLIVAIGVNPDKKPAFPTALRRKWLEELCARWPSVEVGQLGHEFLVTFAATQGAQFILRGIRNEGDYAYERAIRYVNEDLSRQITTVFLIPPREMAEVSSSLVRGLIGPSGWREIVQSYVPPCVFEHLSKTNA